MYEPHWAHYKEEFGKTMANLSDEPELGNGHLYDHDNGLGCSPTMDYPWSRELEVRLKEELGEDFAGQLALLWEQDADAEKTASVRYAYMDQVFPACGRRCFPTDRRMVPGARRSVYRTFDQEQ